MEKLFSSGNFFASILFFILLSTSLVGGEGEATTLSKDDMIVAYYGRPNSAIGVLGRYSVPALVKKVKAKAAEYKKLVGERRVVPGFDLIYDLATSHPGSDKNYITALSRKRVMRYIDAARENGLVVILDLQLGKKTPAQSVRSVLKYLKYDNVHIAIDPEFYVKNLKVRPGKKIGHISGSQVNEAQRLISDYLRKNGIEGNRTLIVHMFTQGMVRNKKVIRNYDHVDLIANLDGHGSPSLKIRIYNGLYTKSLAAKATSGFKLFFREDKPYMMSPSQVLGLKPAQGHRIKTKPRYINYQ